MQVQSLWDAAQALQQTPENCYRDEKGPLGGLGLFFSIVLIYFKNNVLLCQQRKVTCGDSIHSWVLPE